jgi:chemotaxis protein MotB
MARKKHEEHENHERWLVSYADFITLLFAFFTVLYATASSDKGKLDAVVDGLTAAFNGGMPVAVLDSDPRNVAVGPVLEDRDLNLSAQADPTLRTLKMHLDGSLSDNVVEIGLFNQTLTVVLPERVLFDAGSAELHPAAFDVLTSLAEAVKDEPVTVEVTGHADGVPLSGGRFVDNWGLSSARSVATARFLARRGVPVENLVASASITAATNPEARAVTFRIRTDSRSPTGAILDKLYPDG